MTRQIEINTARVFQPLLTPARHKAIHGGRGSAKSHFFAESMVEDALSFPGDAQEGLRAICGREIQKSLKESAKFLIESKLEKFRLREADGFKVYTDRIATPKDGTIVFQGLQDHTADSIKSFEGFHRFWGEEAHGISQQSVSLIRPTIRWENVRLGLKSELWWSWNPRRKTDAVDLMFRGGKPPSNAIVVKSNWSDNPWFPKVLEEERLDCIKNEPEQYTHIWEGGYATVLEGAYFAKQMLLARQENRIGPVAADPHMTIRIFVDVGGTGAKADSFVMIAAQFVGLQVRVLDHYEAQGQELGAHLAWLRSKKFTPGSAEIWLPHDGGTFDKVYRVSYESAFREAGYAVTVVENQGTGAAMLRVEALRRLFPSLWFNEATTEGLLEALGWYHEKRDPDRGNVGLGPEHDWSSHSSDAAGMMAIVWEEPQKATEIKYRKRHFA